MIRSSSPQTTSGTELAEAVGDHLPLAALVGHRARDRPQRGVDAVEALVPEHVLDELARDEAGIGEEPLEDRLELAARLGGDEASM